MSSEVPFHPSLQPNLSMPMFYDGNVIQFCREEKMNLLTLNLLWFYQTEIAWAVFPNL